MRTLVLAAALTFIVSHAQAAEVRMFSAGAVQPGVDAVAARFQRQTGHTVKVTYNTGPQLQAKIAAGETADLLIAPPAVIQPLAARLDGPGVLLGKVGVGVVVRKGAPRPDIASVAALKASVLAAKAVIYNKASTGTHMEGVFKRIGVEDQIAARSVRPANGEGVLQALAAGGGAEIGFGAVTEIVMAAGHGEAVELVGPLPAEVQNETSYLAARFPGAGPEARAFYALLTGAEGKAMMSDNGIR